MNKHKQIGMKKIIAAGMVTCGLAVTAPAVMPQMPVMGSMAAYAEEGEVLTVTVATADELVAAMVPDATQVKRVVLSEDIVLPTAVGNAGGIVMMGESDAPEVILDLNGHNVTTDGGYALHVLRGTVSVTGSGTIAAKTIAAVVKGGWDETVTNYVHVNFGAGVTLKSGAYGLAMMHVADGWNMAHGATVELDGRIEAPYALYINGSVKAMTNPLTVKIGDTAVIEASDTVAYAAGYADWTIGKATMTGKNGFGIRAGKLALNGTKINVTGEMREPVPDLNGMDVIGAVFHIEHLKSYADNVALAINGGEYTSVNGDVFYEMGDLSEEAGTKLADIDITAGNFTAGEGRQVFGGTTEENDVLISGGKFKGSDTAGFAEAGLIAPGMTMNADGTVVKKTPVKPVEPTVEGDFVSEDKSVTIMGMFPGEKVKVEAKLHKDAIAAFKGLKYAAYDIQVLNMAGAAVQPKGTVKVAIKVPEELKGEKTSVYYVDKDGKAKKLAAVYKDGAMNFETDHFSIYALVEDKSVVAPGVVTGGGSVITKPTKTETKGVAPGTGVIAERSGDAVHVFEVAIVLTGACMGAMAWFVYKRISVGKARAAEKVAEKPRVFREIVVDFLD